MKARLLFRQRVVESSCAFAELVLWSVPAPAKGSVHGYKYRLAYVVNQVCVVRYDNEAGKGDHQHFGENESAYVFTSPESLLTDFWNDVKRWNDENPDP